MPNDVSEKAFDKAFMAYQRGELLEALMLFEKSFLLDPTHEEALLNYGRTLRLLQSDELEASERTLKLVSDANGLPGNEDGESGSRKNSASQSAGVQRAGGCTIGGQAVRDEPTGGTENGRAACR